MTTLQAKSFNYSVTYQGKTESVSSAVIVIPNGCKDQDGVFYDAVVSAVNIHGERIRFESVEEAQRWIDENRDNIEFRFEGDRLCARTTKRETLKPEVMYTGGGIWLCAMWLDNNRYCVVDNDCDQIFDECDCITFYDHSENEDDDIEFPCQNMVNEVCVPDMTDEQRSYYETLKRLLLDTMN